MKNIGAFYIFAALILILAGCSTKDSPVAPSGDSRLAAKSGLAAMGTPSTRLANPSHGSFLFDTTDFAGNAGHEVLGIWKIRLYKDGSFEMVPERTPQNHFNVTSIVQGCGTCMKITAGPKPGDNLFDFNITFTNPTNLNAYDVTGIVRSSGDITFVNPDSYTLLFAKTGDMTPNPYMAWAKSVDHRKFAGHATDMQTLRFHTGGFTKFGEIDYVIQASYPSNQEEPYEISGLTSSADLKADGSNATNLRCTVSDWQGNVGGVKVDLTPLGGAADSWMTHLSGDQWGLDGVSYSPTGQGVGDHRLKVTGTSLGVSTYNYIPVKVTSSVPIKDGSFEVVDQNLPLEGLAAPTDGMDIAVMGAADGTSTGMVFGSDDTYHFWSNNYKDGSFGLYDGTSGKPINPFYLPNGHFDFADTSIPDTSDPSIFSLSWGETNNSTDTLDAASIPKVMANYSLALWDLNGGSMHLTANVLTLGKADGPPVTFDVLVRPVDISSGFRQDGLLYVTMAFAAGDPTKFPVVAVMAFHPPLDFSNNKTMVSDGYEVDLPDGAGPGKVNRNALVGVDVDDSGILPIVSGYGGTAWIAAVEAGSENALEIVDADINTGTNTFVTVNLPSAPKDVQILPLTKAGQAGNWIAVLCADNKIRLYNYAGALKETIGGTPYMIGSALRLDIDDQNLAIHVLHQGATSPLVSVYKWAP